MGFSIPVLNPTADAIFVWNVEMGAVISGPWKGSTNHVFAELMAFSQDGKHIISSSQDNTIHLWDVETGNTIFILSHSEGDAIAFLQDSKHFVMGLVDGTICVWDTEIGVIILGPLKGHADNIMSIAFSQDDKVQMITQSLYGMQRVELSYRDYWKATLAGSPLSCSHRMASASCLVQVRKSVCGM